MEHSDDDNYRGGNHSYNGEKNIQQINRGDVIYVIFHVARFLSTSIRSHNRCPGRLFKPSATLS
jgi:hypothetical protein